MGLGKVISKENRNVEYLKETVKLIVNAVVDTLEAVKKNFHSFQFN